MEYDQIACVLELTALVCYGFLILGLALYWPNEANVYLLFFCFSNGILALIGAYKPKEDCELCRWNGILTLFSLTLGFDSLYRSQIERKRMADHQFRLYENRSVYLVIIRSWVVSTISSLAAWNIYHYSSAFQMCFLKASPFAKLDETMISFFWILFFYLRPVTLTVKRIPHILITCHRQMQVLKHERELSINGKLLLYKDHHRRLFHVIISSVSQIVFLTWLTLSLPYVIQLFSLVAGLNSAIRLEEMSPWNAAVFTYLYRSLPLVNCFLFVSAFIVYFSLTLKY